HDADTGRQQLPGPDFQHSGAAARAGRLARGLGHGGPRAGHAGARDARPGRRHQPLQRLCRRARLEPAARPDRADHRRPADAGQDPGIAPLRELRRADAPLRRGAVAAPRARADRQRAAAHAGGPAGRAPLLAPLARHRRYAAHAVEGLAVMHRRRSFEVFTLSFLDTICCGFGAMILLLVLTEVGKPAALEESRKHLDGEVRLLEEQLNIIRGQTDELNRELVGSRETLERERGKLSNLGVVEELLSLYPHVQGLQVMNDQGTYMYEGTRGRWLPDTPEQRKDIRERARKWRAFSQSNPVPGMVEAVRRYWAPDKRVAVF